MDNLYDWSSQKDPFALGFHLQDATWDYSYDQVKIFKRKARELVVFEGDDDKVVVENIFRVEMSGTGEKAGDAFEFSIQTDTNLHVVNSAWITTPPFGAPVHMWRPKRVDGFITGDWMPISSPAILKTTAKTIFDIYIKSL